MGRWGPPAVLRPSTSLIPVENPNFARKRLETWSVTGCRGDIVRRHGVISNPAHPEVQRATQAIRIGASTLLKTGSRQSPGKDPRRGAWKLLTVLAIAQLIALSHRNPRAESPAPAVAVGDDLSSLVIRDSGGETIDLAGGYETLLLVFDPDCLHTTRVAEDWASWLAQGEAEAYRVIAVSSGVLSTAMGYARDKHWNVRVGGVEPDADGKGEHALMNRTPWVFAVRHDGKVVAEGHGIRLAEVAKALQRTTRAD